MYRVRPGTRADRVGLPEAVDTARGEALLVMNQLQQRLRVLIDHTHGGTLFLK